MSSAQDIRCALLPRHRYSLLPDALNTLKRIPHHTFMEKRSCGLAFHIASSTAETQDIPLFSDTVLFAILKMNVNFIYNYLYYTIFY